jgi:hypothetical protein
MSLYCRVGYCRVGSCTRGKLDGFDYCYKHKCPESKCKYTAADCGKHTMCSVYNCDTVSKGNGITLCMYHACNYIGCKEHKETCKEHPKCRYYNGYRYCYEIIYPKKTIYACRQHMCTYISNGVRCKNMSSNCKHKCKIPSCRDSILNDKADFCIHHVCGNSNEGTNEICINYINGCEIHGCIYDCGLHRFDEYKKCINHLTYIDIVDGQSTKDFYFGMLPRDIVNMLKEYLI